MTFEEMQESVSYILDDLNFGYFTLPQVKRWLNNAQFEAQKILIQSDESWFMKCVQTTCLVGQSDYVLPEDFLKTKRVQIVENTNTSNEIRTQIFPIVLSEQARFPTSNDYPATYYIKKNRLVMVPPPDNTYTIRLDYTYRLAELVNNYDVSEIPIQYHEYVVLLAAIDGFLKDDRSPSSLLAKKTWYEDLFKKDAEDRKIDAPRQVVVTKDDEYVYGMY